MGDGSTGAAGPELDDPLATDVGQLAPEAFGEAPPIGVVPDAPAVLQNDRIDRPERSRVGRQVVEKGDDGLLAGMGDVEAGETEALGGCQDVGERARTEAKRLQIDQLVDIAQPLPAPSRS